MTDKKFSEKFRAIRKLNKDEKIPYDLLLLADETIEAINKYIEESEIYIIESETKIVAVYATNVVGKNTVEIKNIAVDEEYQRQGIGNILLSDAIRKAKEGGFTAIVIGTGDASIDLLYLYQKHGFEIFDIKRNFFIDNYPQPIYENGIQLKHMVMLKKEL